MKKIENPYDGAMEITLTLLQAGKETKRWCYFATPAYLYRQFNDATNIPLTLGSHAIFMPILTQEGIENALRRLESQNMLEECTLPLND
jgi:hypothetical protein